MAVILLTRWFRVQARRLLAGPCSGRSGGDSWGLAQEVESVIDGCEQTPDLAIGQTKRVSCLNGALAVEDQVGPVIEAVAAPSREVMIIVRHQPLRHDRHADRHLD